MTSATIRPVSLAMPSLILLLGACDRAGEPALPAVTLDAPVTVSAATEVGAAPILAIAPDGAHTVAWVSAPDGGADGRLYVSTDGAPPVELRDSLGPIEPHGEAPPKLVYGPDGTLHAAYVVGREVPGRRFPMSALRYARSADHGATWSTPESVTDASVFGSYNFHALHAGGDGTVYVSWLDGRDGQSATYMTRSTDGGHSWATNVRVSDGESCPCCRTAMGTGQDGVLYLAWRTVLPGSIRDIVVARSTDRGESWSEPVRVHADDWRFDACPHAGPSLQVDDAGRVHVAWWTGKEGEAGVWYARSDDGARTFGPPVPLGVADFSRPAHAQLALGGDSLVVVAWDDGTLQLPRVAVRVSGDGGATFGPTMLASDSGRAATFPVLTVTGQRLTLAWAEQGSDAAEHAEHTRPDMKDPSSVMPLPSVGSNQVLLRTGVIR